MGDPDDPGRPAGCRPGLRADLGGGGQGRLQHDLEARVEPADRIERAFDPDAIRAIKAAAERDLTVGGPDLAAQATKAGLVDECHLFLAPIVVGGGHAALPDGVRLRLELLDERRFDNGVVYLRYAGDVSRRREPGT